MPKNRSYRPTKHERQFINKAMFKCDQREELLASVAIDCINASTHAQNEVTAVATGSARTTASSTHTMLALAMNFVAGRQMQPLPHEQDALQMLSCKSSGPPPSPPVPKQLPVWHAHQESAWRAHQEGNWREVYGEKEREGRWREHQESAWRTHQKGGVWREGAWGEPPRPRVPRQDPGSVPQGCSVRRDGETSPPGFPGKPPAKSLPGKPPARKALEKIDEATSADEGTACTCDPYMAPGAGPVPAEGKRRRLTELASTSTRS